jgi:hypothetical protein
MRRIDWTDEENESIVADYLSMLVDTLRGVKVNKSEHRRALMRTVLTTRSERSIESKRQNVSAALSMLGYDYLDGYVPLFNIQGSLRDAVEAQLLVRPQLADLIRRRVEAAVEIDPETIEIKEARPPKARDVPRAVREWGQSERRGLITDYSDLERRNSALGRAGELAVVRFEQQRLWKAGKRRLADRVEHVAQTQGDGLGFDVMSFELDGCERLVEVKTTRLAEMTPFFVSRNEVEVSKDRSSIYHLYRLYRFEKSPKLFVLQGSLTTTCRLDPVAYRAEVA